MGVIGYELPRSEWIVGNWIGPKVVDEGQFGTDRILPYELFNEYDQDTQTVSPVEAHDYLVFSRQGGYMLDEHTKDSIVGMRVDCWAKDRFRAEGLANKVVMLMYEMQGQMIDGHSIDYVESLQGPEEDKSQLSQDERCMTIGFEIHIGAKWIYG